MKTKIFDGDYKLTSPYGWRIHPITGKKTFHNGVDFSMKIGTELKCIENGTVRRVTQDKYGGKYVQIKGDSGKGHYHLHISKSLVRQGDRVSDGQVIALSGNTGNTTGAHDHFGMQLNADIWVSHIDPMPYITLDDNTMSFKKRDEIQFTGVQNIRSGSGKQYPVTRQTKAGETAVIKDGPRTADGYTWYDFAFKSGTGWGADVSKFRLYVAPEIPEVTCEDELEVLTKEYNVLLEENDDLLAETARLITELNNLVTAEEEETDVLLAIIYRRMLSEAEDL